MKIVTLTLSPAFDIHCATPSLIIGREHAATILHRDVGGKGINVSRALKSCGTEALTFVVLGRENEKEFLDSLAQEGISARKISTPGRIRENITVRTEDGTETRISFSNDAVSPDLLLQVKETINPVLSRDDVLCLAGSIPKGIPKDPLKEWLLMLRQDGIRTVIDSRSFSSEDLISCRPWLIKPNGEEIASYAGTRVETPEDAIYAAREFFERGIDNVMVSLGKKGAVLMCAEGRFYARPPKIQAKSTIGAGDSAIAGFLSMTANGSNIADCLRRAVAFGSAACLSEGTTPPQPDDVEAIYPLVTLESL